MRKLRTWISLAVAVALSIILFSSCQQNTGGSKEIKIGAILPLSGDAAAYGKTARQGIEIAVEQAAAQNAGKPKIVVNYEDTQADPKTGVTAFRKLVDIDKVKAVVGDLPSSVTLAVAPIAEQSKVILISPGSSAPKLTQAGDYIFRTAYSDIYEGAVLGRFATSELKLKSFGVLYVDNDYGVGFTNEFVKTVTATGARVVAKEKFAQGATDFRTQLTKLNSASPDAIVLLGYKELGRALIQVRELGIKAPLLSSVVFEDPEVLKVAGKAAEGVYYSYPAYNPDSQNAAVRSFVEAYQTKFTDKPDIYAALSYDAAKLLANAIYLTGNDAEAIKKYLYSVRDYDGATGLTSFDSNGDVVKNLGIKRVKNGAFIWVKESYK
jgi:branched-chain amino acid transport system substrate-binding protein